MAGETVVHAITAEDLLAFSRNGGRCELIRGEVQEMSPAGSEHGVVAMRIGWRLGSFVDSKGLGLVMAAETGFILERDPDTVRAPDVAFVKRGRVPSDGLPRAYWPGAPDLAVEVVSPEDSVREVEQKAGQWLRAGASEVWVVHPGLQTVTIYGRLDECQVLGTDDVLDGGDLFLGFECPVRDLFKTI